MLNTNAAGLNNVRPCIHIQWNPGIKTTHTRTQSNSLNSEVVLILKRYRAGRPVGSVNYGVVLFPKSCYYNG